MSNDADPFAMLGWSQLDVFAERPYEGNMLAVFHDGTGLSTEQMLMLARETNLSETTFVLPQSNEEEREHGVRVRIFTTQEELPFAGHPTLGTASWLWWNHARLRGSAEIRLRLNSGVVPVRFQSGEPGAESLYGEMHQADPEFRPFTTALELENALGLREGDLHPQLRPEVVSTGLPFCIVPLCSSEALRRLAIDHRRLTSLLAEGGAKFAYCVAPVAGAEHSQAQMRWHARMQSYNGEDPATGSAAGCAISYLVRHGAVRSGEQVWIEQGREIGRPSLIGARATLDRDAVRDVVVGGRTVSVASGRFMRP